MISSINELKKEILQVAFEAKEGHLGSSFSILDILYVLYNQVANINKNNLDRQDRDYIILSKGHASLGHAAVLKNFNFIDNDQLKSYCKFESILGGHLSKCSVPGVEVSTGSLGHGTAVSIGIALSSKIRKLDNKIFVIVGDGEINEGTFWESLLLASHHKLNNLCFIIDYNRSNDRALKLDPLSKKLKAFGCDVETIDGHDHVSIEQVLSNDTKSPKSIIANTVKGKGIKRMEHNPEWHHKIPSLEELEMMLEELS
tara:strand:- start:1593 stop:2363 length:771 start_codon:yes stop_codon:yes gene_type:complete